MNKSAYQFLVPLWDLSFIFWFTVAFIYGNSPLVTLALALFLGISFAILILKGKPKFTAVFIIYAVFIFICWLNIRLGYSIHETISRAMISTLLKGLLFMCFAYYYASMRGPEKFANIFASAATVCSVVIYGINFLSTGAIIMRGNSAVNANATAVAAAFSICYLVLFDKVKKPSVKAVVCWLIFFCIASGTRKAFIAIVVIMAVYICLKAPKRLIYNVFAVLLILGAAYVILMKIPFIYNAIGYRIESLIVTLQGGTGDESSMSRQSYIELALKYFKDRPVLGHGINCFRVLDGAHETYSHNNYVELLFSVGIVGTVSYYLMYVYVLIRGLARYILTGSKYALISIAFIIAFAVNDIAVVSYYERIAIIVVILCCVLQNAEKSNEQICENNKESV